MPAFYYKSFTRSGKLVEGTMEAGTERDVMMVLRRQDLKVLTIKEKPKSVTEYFSAIRKRKVSAHELVRFTSMFATLVNAGIPVGTCVRTLYEQMENPTFKHVLQNVMIEIEGGQDLSTALSRHPAVFDTMYVDLVRAGEAGGVLHQILERLASYAEKTERLRRRVKGALTYPAVVICIAVVIVWVILTFVVPEFAKTFAQAGKQLPLPTRVLLMASDLVRFYYYWLFLGGVGAWFGFRFALKDPKFQRRWDGFVVKVPVFGDLIMKTAVARFARTLAMLLVGGVPIIQALQIVAHVTGNRMITEALLAVGDSISSGETFAEPMKRSGVFSPLVVQMITVGETTGSMALMLNKIADFYEDEVEVIMGSMSALIEPMMIVFLGVVLGFVIIALFLPILSLSEVIPT
jgi:type IV pilus assembly protein PilC